MRVVFFGEKDWRDAEGKNITYMLSLLA